MHEIRTEIEIAADPERVWAVLMDFPFYPEWNPFIRRVEGELRPGNRLRVTLQPQDGRGMTIRPRILIVAPYRELRWLGRLGFPGLFDGEHFMAIVPVEPGKVRFVHGERFTGILVPFAKAWLEKGVRNGFVAMNQALKHRSEGGGAPDEP